VAREGQDIDVHLFHVDGDGARGLSRVDQECYALLPASGANLFDGLNGAGDIGAMAHHHQRGVGPDRFGDVAGVHKPGSVERNEGSFDAAIAHQVIDRADYRIMLQVCRDDVVAGLEQTGNRQVQGIRGVVAERTGARARLHRRRRIA